MVSLVVKDGQLKVGDTIYAEEKKAKIKSMIDDLGQRQTVVLPSTPVEILGFDEIPTVGSQISTSIKSKTLTTASATQTKPVFSLESVLAVPVEEKKLSLIVKTDTQGSLEAITQSLAKNTNIDIILKAVGNINKSDIFLAKTTKAIVIGFNVIIDPVVRELAKQEKVIIKTYNIIYELLEELSEVADLMKEKEEAEKHLKGEAKVLASFVIEGEKIFGVKVTKGKLNISDELQFFRQNQPFGASKLVSLQIRAKKVTEVKKDQEAGMVFSPPLDIRVGDVVKSIL